MTLKEIEKSDKDTLAPSDISTILKCHPYSINVQAKQDIIQGVNSLGFPITIVGTRVRIPRIPFLEFMGVKSERDDGDSAERT